jgi:hypothetical protein
MLKNLCPADVHICRATRHIWACAAHTNYIGARRNGKNIAGENHTMETVDFNTYSDILTNL